VRWSTIPTSPSRSTRKRDESALHSTELHLRSKILSMPNSNKHRTRFTEIVSSHPQQPRPEEPIAMKAPGSGGLHKLQLVSLSMLDETSREYSPPRHATYCIVLGRYPREPLRQEFERPPHRGPQIGLGCFRRYDIMSIIPAKIGCTYSNFFSDSVVKVR
jgi:hypothetical protein